MQNHNSNLLPTIFERTFPGIKFLEFLDKHYYK